MSFIVHEEWGAEGGILNILGIPGDAYDLVRVMIDYSVFIVRLTYITEKDEKDADGGMEFSLTETYLCDSAVLAGQLTQDPACVHSEIGLVSMAGGYSAFRVVKIEETIDDETDDIIIVCYGENGAKHYSPFRSHDGKGLRDVKVIYLDEATA